MSFASTLLHARSRTLLFCTLLLVFAASRPGSASAQSMFYGFEGEGWTQSIDEFSIFGDARVAMNRASQRREAT